MKDSRSSPSERGSGQVDGVERSNAVLAETGGGFERGLVDGDERDAGEDGSRPLGGWRRSAACGGEMNLDERQRAGDAARRLRRAARSAGLSRSSTTSLTMADASR